MAITKGSGANFIDRTGQRFGRWVVVERHPQKKLVRWICRCDCGKQRAVVAGDLVSGRSKSCGCLRLESSGKSLRKIHKREYHSWIGMRQRCLYSGHIEFHRYGGRGISICSQWMASFENFLKDMGVCPDGYSLDRINLDGPYSPQNCRWATKAEQSVNTSRNVHVELDGERMTLKQLATKIGINYYRLHAYYRRRGLSLDEAIARSKEKGISRRHLTKQEYPPASSSDKA